MTTAIRKYPRTRHLEGSRLQPGDEDLEALAFDQLRGRHLVVEEKVDGANAAVSFDEDGSLWLQSRGHYLRGGAREKHFALLKTWASGLQSPLRDRLGPRHVMFGEWVYAKHTVYYDELPHYFLEFDVLDREHGVFLSTERRRRLLAGLPIASVPVLSEGSFDRLEDLVRWVGPSTLKGKRWRERLRDVARGVPHLDVDRVERETDMSDAMEGLYIKVEEDGCVVERAKFVRASFLTVVLDAESHWLSRPIVPNGLRDGVDLFAGHVGAE
ncbi:MAG: DNA ligase [Deltaproteobacteria bacterium HGW-Deltaproteobacteria-20]|jgi:hypothetical protein|nr:MAG: DNA ligase [Deltaproteobacteria bacterium HGW-Deltaproteobacteria-20]